MKICNACRYCEGYCGVFPAMMRRTTFPDADLVYLANLCHGCRGCYYACQYAPPHEFEVNLPKTFSELSVQGYRDFAWPKSIAGAFHRNGVKLSLTTAAILTLVMLLTFLMQDTSVLVTAHRGEGAFYKIIPHWFMVLPAMAIFVFSLVSLGFGFYGFWRTIGGTSAQLLDSRKLWGATADAANLRYLAGGGDGCNYPDEHFSHARRWYHHAMMYGFLACFAATCVATVYHFVFDWEAPYPLMSWPVLLGTMGGIGLVVGTGGLLWLKTQSDPEPNSRTTTAMDVAFLILLLLTSLSGLALLALRGTPAMGALLAIHFSIVLALFLALPYSKFVHSVYRFGALIKYASERGRTGVQVMDND